MNQPFLNDDDFFKSVKMNESGRLIKAKRMPIGTVSKGMKKIAEGKWVPVKKEKKTIFSKEINNVIKSFQNKYNLKNLKLIELKCIHFSNKFSKFLNEKKIDNTFYGIIEEDQDHVNTHFMNVIKDKKGNKYTIDWTLNQFHDAKVPTITLLKDYKKKSKFSIDYEKEFEKINDNIASEWYEDVDL